MFYTGVYWSILVYTGLYWFVLVVPAVLSSGGVRPGAGGGEAAVGDGTVLHAQGKAAAGCHGDSRGTLWGGGRYGVGGTVEVTALFPPIGALGSKACSAWVSGTPITPHGTPNNPPITPQ